MPEILDHVAYLSQEIGPRPAGTEEEQQAALYITEQIQKEAGLSAVIEDFGGAADADLPRMVCSACTVVIAALALFIPVLGIPAIIITLITAALFVAEALHRPVLSKVFARGVSQNVVAKYEPSFSAETGGTRRRKVILVSRYDSGKVRLEAGYPLVSALPAVQWATLGAMVLVPILLIIQNVFFLNAGGTIDLVLKVLIVIALLIAVIPLVFGILHKTASYNEGANCNAAGTAVLLEVARRIGRGRVSEAELVARGEAAIHGEEAARAAGLVPDGAQLVYEDQGIKAPEPAPQSPESRLASAKAAVAALTGKPVSGVSAADIAFNLVQVKDPPLPRPTDEAYHEQRGETREAFSTIPSDTMQAALDHASSDAQDLVADGVSDGSQVFNAAIPVRSVPSAASSSHVSDDVPDWFKQAQEKAKKPRGDKPAQRSHYANALDDAVSESADHFAEANNIVDHKLEESLGSGREVIQEIKAPQWSSFAPAAPEPSASESAPAPVAAVAQPEVAPQSSAAADPFATTALPPIDVSNLHLDDVLPISNPVMPSFLDPQKVQEDARAHYKDEQRTDKRVDVTDAAIGTTGRIEYSPLADELAAASNDIQNADQSAHRPIMLPDIGISAAKPAPISELQKQRAPLAEGETSGKNAAKSLLTMLPSISVGEENANSAGDESSDSEAVTPTTTSPKASLRAVLPSLSGAISRASAPEARQSNVNAAGSFAPAGATGAFAPIGDELLENVDPNDIYVDDADDSAYDENFTETGAFAGPGYVEMPKSRVQRLFDRFRKKDKGEDETPQEWLAVDDSFDAREVGAQRGNWESFRAEGAAAQDPSATVRFDGSDNSFDNGAFDDDDLYARTEYAGDEQQLASADSYDAPDDFNVDDVDNFEDFSDNDRPRWHGGAFSSRRLGTSDLDSEEIPDEAPLALDPNEAADELKQIYQFRNPDINTEVWFVALGSELSQNAGMQAFLAEHQQDLRGSIIIDLDALGAGELCMVDQEGTYKAVKTSSRMKRYVKKASQATGLGVGSARMLWEESSASFALRHGFQAMHLVGMDGAKPAFYAQGDDVVENIDEETLSNNADFVMELVKNI